MNFNDKITKSVADAAAKIMQETASTPTKSKEKDGAPFEGGRPAKGTVTDKSGAKHSAYSRARDLARRGEKQAEKSMKEETEQLDEGWAEMMADVKKRSGPQPSGSAGVKQGTRYGGGKQKADSGDAETAKSDAQPVKRGRGRPRKFSEMVELYLNSGLKSISEMVGIEEEVDNETFKKELEDQKASAEGKKKQPHVAAAASQATKDVNEELTLEDFTVEQLEQFMQTEEYQQLDELSRATLNSYLRKSKDRSTQFHNMGVDARNKKKASKFFAKRDMVDQSRSGARLRLKGEFRPKSAFYRAEEYTLEDFSSEELEQFMQTEEYEQLDEISKQKLGAYIKKASHDVAARGAVTRQLSVDARAAKARGEHRTARETETKANKAFLKSWKRREGMAKAVDRLTKEETEQLDELSKTTLGSYVKKAALDSAMRMGQAATMKNKAAANAEAKKAGKRYGGVVKATDRLAKEEVEQIDERAKWRSSSAAKKDLDPDDTSGVASDYFYDNPRSTGTLKATSDKPHSYGSLMSRPKGAEVVGRGPRSGKITKRHAERLKSRMMSALATEQIDERELSSAETTEKERIVKGMKKNLKGFKQRYGERAKEVMYATATKAAKKDD